MEYHRILIPKGIHYLGDERMKELMPDFEFKFGIYNKEITGCGATTWILKEEKMNVVLLVPRITLLKNKVEQTPDCQAVYGEIETTEIIKYIESHQNMYVRLSCKIEEIAWRHMEWLSHLC